MKYSAIFRDRIKCSNPDEVFDHLMSTLAKSNRRWDYFVNWTKVFANLQDAEIDLNTLNYLVGKEDAEVAFAELLRKRPSIAGLVPLLVACRQDKFTILSSFQDGRFEHCDYSFRFTGRLSEEEIGQAVDFAKNTGFLEQLSSKRIRSVWDYAVGVEVGLDSNARKNRGGTAMEEILEHFISDICQRRGLEYLAQVSASSVKSRWGVELAVDKSSRRVDFAVRTARQLYLVEANFYGGGGSKLKATAGEYRTMHDFWTAGGHKFIWVTDGAGWHSTRAALRETFDHIDYVLNLSMVAAGLLEDVLTRGL